jgi:7,8-dihydropterin-6-yl-methyl-4-(beta-D-ribofuranosyl)aminobenzene 5'-phosphate synthase
MEEKGENVLLVMGGFHLLRTGTDAVQTIATEFRERNIKYVSPTHCSGDGTIEIFKETFGDQYIRSGAGKIINTADL